METTDLTAQQKLFDALLGEGVARQYAGDLAEAENCYRDALARTPEEPAALHLLGTVLYARGRATDAVAVYQRAQAQVPDDPILLNNLALALGESGRRGEAIAALREALAIDPEYAAAHTNLAGVLLEDDQLEAAIDAYRRASALAPQDAKVAYNLGVALQRAERMPEAVEALRRALALAPGKAGPAVNLGTVLIESGAPAEALRVLRAVLRRDPRNAAAHVGCGNALVTLRDYAEARRAYHAALALKPDFAEACNNLGWALRCEGDLGGALAAFERAIALQPAFANAHANRAFLLLLQGRFAGGWPEYVWRVASRGRHDYVADPRAPEHTLPRPQPQAALAGRHVLLVRDQGIGDELFFLRFVPELLRRGARVSCLASRQMLPFAARINGIGWVGAERAQAPAADLALAVSDLPLLLGLGDDDALPPPLPLQPAVAALAAAADLLAMVAGPPLLGVTWRAGAEERLPTGGRLVKEVPLEPLAHALRAWDGELVVLQRNPRPGEIDALERLSGKPVRDLSGLNTNLEHMLAALSLLDDYVCVSNTNLHLGAGLGKPARVLVPHPGEWRWLAAGAASPWFPQATVYRETAGHDWAAALAGLRTDLQRASTA